MDPATLVCQDDALNSRAAWPGPGFLLHLFIVIRHVLKHLMQTQARPPRQGLGPAASRVRSWEARVSASILCRWLLHMAPPRDLDICRSRRKLHPNSWDPRAGHRGMGPLHLDPAGEGCAQAGELEAGGPLAERPGHPRELSSLAGPRGLRA